MKLLFLILSIFCIAGCASSGSFNYIINDNEVELSKLKLICVDCQNNDKKYQDYENEINKLLSELQYASNQVQKRYGNNAPLDKYTSATASYNLAHSNKVNEFNSFQDNKCFKYYITYGNDGNIYIFINKPNFLLKSDGKDFSSINEMTIQYSFSTIRFEIVNEAGISYYDATKLFLHFVKLKPTTDEIDLLMNSQPSRIILKYDVDYYRNPLIIE